MRERGEAECIRSVVLADGAGINHSVIPGRVLESG